MGHPIEDMAFGDHDRPDPKQVKWFAERLASLSVKYQVKEGFVASLLLAAQDALTETGSRISAKQLVADIEASLPDGAHAPIAEIVAMYVTLRTKGAG